DQDFQCRGRPVTEHEHPAVERIVPEHFLADPSQAVDPTPEIGRFDGHENPHLRGYLDHDTGFQKLRQSAVRSSGVAAFRWTRIFDPTVSSSSNVQSYVPVGTAGNSTKVVPGLGSCLSRAATDSCSSRFLSE